MEKTIRIPSKNLTINSVVVVICFFYNFLYAQEKIVDYFDSDKIKDTLYYKCISSTVEPNCNIRIETGKTQKKHEFDIPFVGNVIITNCGQGCISFYDDAKDTEYTQEYRYYPKYNNWILTLDETMYNYENGRIESNLQKKYLIGIDGKKIKIK
ncbi:hypothetical protein [Riemerella anatipestifer]|uniref:hypothetical protein n=1 Tax=Riemerella anatipestifer TaxID=34085 RepID=UPI00129E376F|nr:hypothetical protein [Riemerella anatipestifer]